MNHLRTLLLNLSGDLGPVLDYPGEEYVPPGFRPVRLGTAASAARRLLFGGAPDRAMLNYRLRQLLSFVHGTEMADLALALDPRITYWPPRKGLSWPAGTTVRQFSGTTPSLSFVGDATPREQFGRLFNEWQVRIEDGDGAVSVTYYDPGERLSRSQAFPPGEAFPLPGGPLRAQAHGGPGSAWAVRSLARPDRGVPEAITALEVGLGEGAVDELFGRNPEEPYRTFRNLWLDHNQSHYRLGGLALALGYRTHEAWRG